MERAGQLVPVSDCAAVDAEASGVRGVRACGADVRVAAGGAGDAETEPERIKDLLVAMGGERFRAEAGEMRVTCSLGVAAFDPKVDAVAHLEVLRRADAALYAAKAAGRNCARSAEAGVGKGLGK